jgi:hypothetical protein
MKQLGAGSTAIVFGSRGPGQVGHFFNVVNKDGKIEFLDFQKSGSAVMSNTEVQNFQSLWFLNTTNK